MSYAEADRPSRGLQVLGWTVLLLGLPLALFGALAPPNEYKAIFGSNALDCDGPLGVYICAVPALVLYGIALVINGLRWRRATNLIVAIVSLGICAAVAVNLARAIAEDREQAEACQAR